jgi:hypothetical protein
MGHWNCLTVSTFYAVHGHLEGGEFETDLILSAGDLFLLGVALSCSVISMLKTLYRLNWDEVPKNAHRTFKPSFSSFITAFQTKSTLTWPWYAHPF